MNPSLPADPRPQLVDGAVAGSTCAACGHHSTRRSGRCERCLGEVRAAGFGPGGVVWASTTVHLRIGDRNPPFVLAYVDLDSGTSDGGPRVLALVRPAVELPAGTPVAVVDAEDGDLVVEAAA